MRRTRVVTTIGPASWDLDKMEALINSGADVFRLNYSHGEPEDKTELYDRIRSLEDKLGKPTCILADLPGPKLRLGNFPGVVVLNSGDEVILNCGVKEMAAAGNSLPVEYDGLKLVIALLIALSAEMLSQSAPVKLEVWDSHMNTE